MTESDHRCKCGCGALTKTMDRTDPRRVLVKGEPYPYAKGHSQRRPDFVGELPYCLCGCGKQTELAKWTRGGHVRGQPMPYLQGHYGGRIIPITDPSRCTIEDRGYSTLCWITTSSKDKDGYGVIIGGKRSLRGNERAHRRSYEENIGPIPEGWHIDHLCEQPGCVRPDHLEAKSPTDHMRRHSVLTTDMVRVIRASTKTHQQLADEYGTTRSNIGYIKRHKTWIENNP